MTPKTKTIAAIFIAAVMIISGCAKPVTENPPINPGTMADFKEMPRFADENAMLAYFEQSGQGRQHGIADNIGQVARWGAVLYAMPTAPAASDTAQKNYSETNVQVEGVDEADIVKTDGKYIYVFSKSKIMIVDAYPAQSGKVISSIDLGNVSPTEMFVQGNKLLVFGSEYQNIDYGGAMPIGRHYPYQGNSAVAILYDITSRQSPIEEKRIEFEGSYLTSRLVDGKAVFVVNSYPRYYYAQEQNNEGIIPVMRIDGKESKIAAPGQIGYLPPMPAQSFVTIAVLNINTEELTKETIAGNAQAVFASEKNIYLSSSAWMPPQTPIVKDVQRIIAGDTESTVVNKFSFSGGKIGFIGQGIVPGHVLNQFSMDEYEGNFRIATTSGNTWDEINPSQNNLYVLGSDMNITGKLEGLAPGEKIYSARFMGAKAYLVTFKKVDPLFVIDLKDPQNPKVLGKLKIPGYSDYLHPIDENHIIGVGKDTIESGYGNFAWYQGMKMAIFDVSDVANPKEMHKINIGDRGTDSFALQNHKAFLYDKSTGLLVLPIELHEIKNKHPIEPDSNPMERRAMPEYGEATFQGAFVYKVTLENGFEERARITHATAQDELMRGYDYYGDYIVQRSLFIEDTLYTISQRMVKSNDLQTLKEIAKFEFGN